MSRLPLYLKTTCITRPCMSIPGCHTDFCYYLGPSLPFYSHWCLWKSEVIHWNYTCLLCVVLRAVFSYRWVLQSFAMPGLTRWPKGEPDTEHSWTHYEPELSIITFSQLLNTSSCTSENSEVREEDCQNSVRLHISIPVPLASFNHRCTCTPGQKQSPTC